MPTQRYAHRLSLLRYAPSFKALDAGHQDSLLKRLYAVHDACELSRSDRSFLRASMMEVAGGAVKSELPGSEVDWGLMDEAVDSEDDDFIEGVLDRIGSTAEFPLTEADARWIASEAKGYADSARTRPVLTAADFVPGMGAIWHYETPWPDGPSTGDNDREVGTGPFTALLVLRVHATDGTLDVCLMKDAPYSPEHERLERGDVPPARAFIGLNTPTQVWLGLDPAKQNIHPDFGNAYEPTQLASLLKRLHLM
ncbi:hypothetical protein GGQ22_19620 [Nocardioides sp. zg-579]|uniref:Uncharacterized protein n=1 Tax=Nocardioides marmotae TaxID=2663857 RepID=A0A6I3JH83_9ACTN|nr:hypothetical protein [Nocardioides marmotae]MCR6033620.1 hypothetical protein [Gordonia jinghuaiqii]MTB97278.1 hypothetical protein [Nocardioides marmotae]QKE01820.1 hypothetical protein HPC71_12625 [Nocardioides marmotae]